MPAVLKVVLLGTQFGIAPTTGFLSFDSFAQLYRRSYLPGATDYKERERIYEQNVAAARVQNNRVDRLWTAGANHLWDWSEAEMQSLRGWDGSLRPESGGIRSHALFLQRSQDLPEEKLWTGLGMTRRVKNQGPCGSCWAVATASVLEGHVEINSGIDRTFSAQQMVSCTPNPRDCGGDGGCKGATAELAMEWVLNNGCVEESQIPYSAVDGICTSTTFGEYTSIHQHNGSISAPPSLPFVPKTIADRGGQHNQRGGHEFGMVGWETLPNNKMEPLLRALAEQGPAVISVGASAWALYKAGIFDGCQKDVVVDHAVTAIGYGKAGGVKYFLIQNSWGADWGEHGQIRVLRHEVWDEYCGMNSKPEQGMGCKGETAPVPVCGMCGVLFDSVVPRMTHTRASL